MILGLIFFVLSLIIGGLFFLAITSEYKKSLKEERDEMEKEQFESQ